MSNSSTVIEGIVVNLDAEVRSSGRVYNEVMYHCARPGVQFLAEVPIYLFQSVQPSSRAQKASYSM